MRVVKFLTRHTQKRPETRTSRRALLALTGALVLSACMPSGLGGLSSRINPNRPVTVALLVPTGSATQGDAILAANLENAARMAVADLSGVQIDLRVYDTQGDPAVAAQMARQAADDGAGIILGPVRSAEANERVCTPTSRWLIRLCWLLCTNSIGSSTVRM